MGQSSTYTKARTKLQTLEWSMSLCHKGLHVTLARAMFQNWQSRRKPSSLAIIRFNCQDR
jgi:hypothetical protein